MLAYIVYNNTFVINNNINIWKNSWEIYSFIYDKWHINVETDRKYNTDWEWFNDLITCPTNVTMSWSTYSWTNISTSMTYDKWSIFCQWIYRTRPFRLYFDETIPNLFKQAFFTWSIVSLNYSLKPSEKYNISVNSYLDYRNPRVATNSIDNSSSSYYSSNSGIGKWIKYDLSSAKKIKTIKVKKASTSSSYWKNGKLEFYNSSNTLVFSSNIVNLNKTTQTDVYTYIWAYASASDIKYVRLIVTDSTNKYLDVANFEVWSLESDTPVFTSSWTFAYDNTKMTFASWFVLDGIDDDFNSDDYRYSSTWNIAYSNWFQDNDDTARKTVFWNVSALSTLYNIFWNNSKTNKFINDNVNNTWTLNLNIWYSTWAYLYLDLFSFSWTLNYDLKVLEFDKASYDNDFTLLPKASYIWTNLTTNNWYIWNFWSLLLQTSTWSNSLLFDFKNKDYAIFITNLKSTNISYRISWIDKISSKQIYINPIDDSWPTIRSLSNHMLIWDERNFIWEHITIVWNK